VQQFDTAPYFQASYVQMVTDPAWNRLIYGDYQKWIKAYDAVESGLPLNRPQGIVVDPNGVVYVADTGNSRVLVLKLSGPANDISLSYLGAIGGNELSQPTELAWDDRGTIFDARDDLLWVVDRGVSELVAYRTALNAAERLIKFRADDFVELSALAIGRFDGRSDGNIYIADAGARKIHRLYFDGAQINSAGVFQGETEMVPSALATDHWGNLYLSDEAHRQIQKFSPALEPLATLLPEDSNFQPVRFQPLFGSVVTSANQPAWSGYDQAFLLEKWTDNSGGRCYEFGIDLQINELQLTEDLSALSFTGKLTDPGYLMLELVSAQRHEGASTLIDEWRNAGTMQLRWDRRLANGEMIAPGYYNCAICSGPLMKNRK
jgi:sugar lactone lactonase YvrE